jgi:hypothetical protein
MIVYLFLLILYKNLLNLQESKQEFLPVLDFPDFFRGEGSHPHNRR